MLYRFNRDTIVIGHSMGGLIALALEQDLSVREIDPNHVRHKIVE